MELRHFRYFVAVAEALNFRKASHLLHVAQPTLSKQIKDLETELGVQLLDRDTHGVRLTPAGAVFLKEIRLSLIQVEEAIAATRATNAGPRKSLTIGYVASLLVRFMPPTLKAFNEAFPGIEVVLVELPLSKQLAAVKSGAVQLGFTLRDGSEPPCPLPHFEIIRSPLCVALSRSHRLAAMDSVPLGALVREPLVCLAAQRGSPREHLAIMRRIFATRGLKTGPIKEIEGTEALRATLESGLGVSLVAGIGTLAEAENVVLKPLADIGADLMLEVLAVWAEDPPPAMIADFVAGMHRIALQEMRPGAH